MIEKSLPKIIIYVCMGLMIITGSINTISNKMQNNSVALGQSYQHVWFITFCMFLGEMICILGYLMWKLIRYYKNKHHKILIEIKLREDGVPLKRANPFHLALPALCDFFGSTIMTFGLSMMAGSVYQMLRGSLILFTALFSIIFLKNKLYRHNYLALILVTLGLILVGLANKLYPTLFPPECSHNAELENSIWGILLVIIAQLFAAMQYILEEKFMKSYNCHPLKAIGWEGIWGSSLYLILLIIFQFIHCTGVNEENVFSNICTRNEKEWILEDTLFAFKQMNNSSSLLVMVIIYILSIALFNITGIIVAKYSSSTARAILSSIRVILVWTFFLLPFINVCHRESFNWIQLIGFVLLILGTLIYNEIIIIPCCGFNLYTIKTLEILQKEKINIQLKNFKYFLKTQEHELKTENSFFNNNHNIISINSFNIIEKCTCKQDVNQTI